MIHPLSAAFFHRKSAKFAVSTITDIDCILIHNFQLQFWLMLAKMATLGLLKIKVFWNKAHDVIIFVNYVINKILSRYSNYIKDVVMWPKFGNLSFLWEELLQPQFYKGLTEKAIFLQGWSWFKFNNFLLILGMSL